MKDIKWLINISIWTSWIVLGLRLKLGRHLSHLQILRRFGLACIFGAQWLKIQKLDQQKQISAASGKALHLSRESTAHEIRDDVATFDCKEHSFIYNSSTWFWGFFFPPNYLSDIVNQNPTKYQFFNQNHEVTSGWRAARQHTRSSNGSPSQTLIPFLSVFDQMQHSTLLTHNRELIELCAHAWTLEHQQMRKQLWIRLSICMNALLFTPTEREMEGGRETGRWVKKKGQQSIRRLIQ